MARQGNLLGMDTMYEHALAYGHLASPSDELEYPVWQHQGTPVNVQCKSGLQMACDLDQSAMAAGRMEKPARFWMVGTRSLIHWQSTDMQRLRRVIKSEVWDGVP